MIIERGGGDDRLDRETEERLRGLYAPPIHESYWDSLERRIMERVQVEGLGAREWWSHFRGWERLGLAAAAATLLIASAAAIRAREARERMAYRDTLDIPSSLPILSGTVGDEPNKSREATLQYLLTHD